MKINKRIYDLVTSEPISKQETEHGIIEVHNMNQNENLYEEYAKRQGKFALWTSKDGQTYRLIIEEGFYEEAKPLYSKKVNQIWLEFWDAVEKARNRTMTHFIIPITLVVFILLGLSTLIPKNQGQMQMIVLIGIFIGYIISTMVVRKRVDSAINRHNQEAIEKIKNIVGHEKFQSLLEKQRTYYDQFFNISATAPEEETAPSVLEETAEQILVAEEMPLIVEETEKEKE